MVHMCEPEEIHFVVVGGETNGYWRIMDCTIRRRCRWTNGANGTENSKAVNSQE